MSARSYWQSRSLEQTYLELDIIDLDIINHEIVQTGL